MKKSHSYLHWNIKTTKIFGKLPKNRGVLVNFPQKRVGENHAIPPLNTYGPVVTLREIFWSPYREVGKKGEEGGGKVYILL